MPGKQSTTLEVEKIEITTLSREIKVFLGNPLLSQTETITIKYGQEDFDQILKNLMHEVTRILEYTF